MGEVTGIVAGHDMVAPRLYNSITKETCCVSVNQLFKTALLFQMKKVGIGGDGISSDIMPWIPSSSKQPLTPGELIFVIWKSAIILRVLYVATVGWQL